MAELLLYPQVVLLLAPIPLRIIWSACRPMLLRTRPRTRAAVLFTMTVLPVVAVGVPYVPELAAHLPVPWRAPIAWGMMNHPAPTDTIAYLTAYLIAAALLLVPPLALAVLIVRSSLQTRAFTRLGGEPHPAGFTLIPGHAIALTVGLWRPRVLLSADVWNSEHGVVVLHHERAHVKGHHPLLLIVARAALVLWWWIPGSALLLDDLRDALEESADAAAAQHHGRLRVARAIVEGAAGHAPAPMIGFGGPGGVEQRVAALAHGTDPALTRKVAIVSVMAVPLWLLFL